jgi:hypothetical protein
MVQKVTPVDPKRDPWSTVFNTPLECGLRSATLLLAAYPATCDLQRLVQYDYLVVHSGDVEDGPPSIHPATPNRSGELLVRRSLVEDGLAFMSHKQVVEPQFSEGGIAYKAGEYAAVFIDALSSEYARTLRERAAWVIARFQSVPDEDLSDYMRSRWSSWGSEFVSESLMTMAE